MYPNSYGQVANKLKANPPGAAPAPQQQSQPMGGTPLHQQSYQQQQPQQKQAYNPTQAPNGMDQTMPGYAEQYWQNNQNMFQQAPQIDWASQQLPQYNSPGFGESYNTNAVNAFGAPGQGSQFWNQIAGQFNKQNGGNLQPQFDQYYDRAEAKALGAANQQAAARGAYGSSAALNNVGNVINDFEAQRAKAGTDFALQNSQNMQNMANTYGNLAFGAGNEDLRRMGMGSDIAFHVGDQQQNRLNQGINNALQLDQAGLNHINSGFNAALQAQNAYTQRGQNAFNNNLAYLNTVLPWAQGNYDAMFNRDNSIMGAGIDASLGKASQAQNYAGQARAGAENSVKEGVGLATGIAGLSGNSPVPQAQSYNPYGRLDTQNPYG